MFTDCLGFDCADPERQGVDLFTAKNKGRIKSNTIRIGGSCKDSSSSPANSSGYASCRSQSGIDVTKKPTRRKIRPGSIIKGPDMDVDKIKRKFGLPN